MYFTGQGFKFFIGKVLNPRSSIFRKVKIIFHTLLEWFYTQHLLFLTRGRYKLNFTVWRNGFKLSIFYFWQLDGKNCISLFIGLILNPRSSIHDNYAVICILQMAGESNIFCSWEIDRKICISLCNEKGLNTDRYNKLFSFNIYSEWTRWGLKAISTLLSALKVHIRKLSMYIPTQIFR